MDTTRKGDKLEHRAQRSVVRLGYRVVATAKRRPVFSRGRVVANDGNIDLADGAIDFIAVSPGKPTLFVQVTTTKGTSARRIKLRAIAPIFDDAFHHVILMAWNDETHIWHVYRKQDDYLDHGHRMSHEPTIWPWEQPSRQVTL